MGTDDSDAFLCPDGTLPQRVIISRQRSLSATTSEPPESVMEENYTDGVPILR